MQVMSLRMLVDHRLYQLPGCGQGHKKGAKQGAGGSQAASDGAADAAGPTELVAPDLEGLTIADKINEHLPSPIRVFAVQKVRC